MISLGTLHRFIISLIQRSAQMQVERTSPAEILTGLSPVTSAEHFAIDFGGLAKGQTDSVQTNIEL